MSNAGMISVDERRVLRRLADLHAVYRMFDHAGRLLYVGLTKNPGGRFGSHMEKRWFLQVAEIKLEWFPTRAAAILAEQRAIRDEHPRLNIAGSSRKPHLQVAGPLPASLQLSELPSGESRQRRSPHPVTAGLPASLQLSELPGLIGLSMACREGVTSLSLAAVRKRRQRDPGFPPIAGKHGPESLYELTQLIEWEENR